MSNLAWAVGDVTITTRDGRSTRLGLIRNGLGLDERKPKRGDSQWALTHLPTGLQVCMLEGPLFVILPVATEIADCAEWNANGFAVSAELAATVREIGARSEGVYYRQADEYSPGALQ